MKKILSVLLLLSMMFPISVYAAEIDVKKDVSTYESYTSNKGGEITFTISNITVNDGATYNYQLISGDKTTQWYTVDSTSTNQIVLTLDKNKSDILDILASSNEAYLSIKEVKDGVETIVLSSYKIDISMPLSRAFKIGHWQSGYHGIDPIYDVDKVYYKYVKIDNEELIKKYLEYLKGYKDSSNIYWGFYVDNLIDEVGIHDEIPTDGWEELVGTQTTTQPTEEGLYYLWIKAPTSDVNKELVGCVFSKRFSDIKVLENQLQEVIDSKGDGEPSSPPQEDKPVVEEQPKEEDKTPVVDEQPDEETPVVEESKKENKEETVENPPTGLYISIGVIVMIILSTCGFVTLRKKNYFSKI